MKTKKDKNKDFKKLIRISNSMKLEMLNTIFNMVEIKLEDKTVKIRVDGINDNSMLVSLLLTVCEKILVEQTIDNERLDSIKCELDIMLTKLIPEIYGGK